MIPFGNSALYIYFLISLEAIFEKLDKLALYFEKDTRYFMAISGKISACYTGYSILVARYSSILLIHGLTSQMEVGHVPHQ